MQSTSILDSDIETKLLSCDVKGVSLCELATKYSKEMLFKKTVFEDDVKGNSFLFKRFSSTHYNETKNMEKISIYQIQLKKMIECLNIIVSSFNCAFVEQHSSVVVSVSCAEGDLKAVSPKKMAGQQN